MPLDGTEGQGIANLGQGIAQTIMLNTRARLAQAQIGRQMVNDQFLNLERQAQTQKLNQQVKDLVDMAERVKAAERSAKDVFGDTNAAPFAASVARSPSASVKFLQGIKTSPGQQVDVPFGPRVVNEQPRVLGLNQQLVPNIEGQSGYVGSSAAGIYTPATTNSQAFQVAPAAPSHSTPQADVEGLRRLRQAANMTEKELEMIQESDPNLHSQIMQLRKQYWSSQFAMPQTMQQTNVQTAPIQIKSIKQSK